MTMRKYLIWALTGLLFAACSKPVPVAQDGTDLWLAGARSYEEIYDEIYYSFLPRLHPEEYRIYDKEGIRHIDAGSEAGLRYGIYALQRAEVLGEAGPGINIIGKPYYDIRVLNHWDNLDDTVERGYAGKSMWEWTSPEIPVERIRHYGELCASIGLNGAALNNVNSNPLILDAEHIRSRTSSANTASRPTCPSNGPAPSRSPA